MTRTFVAILGPMTLLFCLTAAAQEKSVRPDINKSFQKPDVAQFVERFEREGREVYDHREKIIELCDVQPGTFVADIGTGTGLFTRLLSPRVGEKGRIFAVDIAREFVNHVQKSCNEDGLTNVVGVVCRQDSAGLPENSIDLAFICDTYHHFEYPYKTMRSIHRALRPGGHVVLVEFHRKQGVSSEWILGHVRADQKTFADEIKTAGFDVVEEQKFLKTSYWMKFKKSERRNESGHTVDSLETVKRLLADKTAMLIDVREQNEWDAGHLQAAKLLPVSLLRKANNDNELAAKASKLRPEDKIIYCHCRSGKRTLVAASMLRKLGYDVRPLKASFSELKTAGFKADLNND